MSMRNGFLEKQNLQKTHLAMVSFVDVVRLLFHHQLDYVDDEYLDLSSKVHSVMVIVVADPKKTSVFLFRIFELSNQDLRVHIGHHYSLNVMLVL